MEDNQYCPPSLQSNKVNIKNHLYTMENHGLGPVDPREPNNEFWKEKAMHWLTTERLARGRLCANCEYYINTSDILSCIANGPAYDFKTSDVPTTPKLADVEEHPVAWCKKFDITCSPTRTCNEQEMGGPIDDERMAAMEFEDPFKDSTEED